MAKVKVRVLVSDQPADVMLARTLLWEYQLDTAAAVGRVPLDDDVVEADLDPGAPWWVAPGAVLATMVDDGNPAGLVLLAVHQHGEADLRRLWVRPEARRHGHAVLLCGATIERAQLAGARAVGLDCLASRRAALDLYQRLGFVETGQHWVAGWGRLIDLRLELGCA